MTLRPKLCIVGVLLAGMVNLRAQTWTGLGSDTNWSTGANWMGGVSPLSGAFTNVFFGAFNGSPFTSTVDTSYTIGNLQVTLGAGPFTLNSSGGSILTVDNTIVDTSTNAFTVNIGIASPNLSFDISNGGTVTINSTNNTFTGQFRVTSGTLSDGAADAFSPNAMIWIASPGIVNVSFNETIAGLSDDPMGGNGSLVIAGGRTLFISSSFVTTFSGVISGNGGIEMDTGGMLTLSGANSYLGTTVLNSGTTLADGAPNSFSPSSLVSVNTGSNLNVNFNETVGGLQGTGGTVNIASEAVLFDSTPGPVAFPGTITGPGSLTIGGTGTQTLSGMSTYSGGTLVQSELFVGSSTNGPPGSFTAGPVGTGTLSFEFLSELSPSANVTLANNIFLNDDTQYIDNDDGGSNNLTLTGFISGGSGLEWCTTGILELTGANTFSGGIDMREGTLLLGSSTVGPPGAIVSGPIGTGGLVLDDGTVMAAAIPGVTFANPINLTGNAQLGAGVSDNNALNITGQISGSGILTYVGGPTGSLTLSSSNNYTGSTMVGGGTLYANDPLAFGNGSNTVVLNGGGLSVNSGVTISNSISTFGVGNVISGSGMIASPVTIDGTVTLAPGDPLGSRIGNLTFSQNLTLTTNGSIAFNLFDANGPAGTGYSLISVTNPGNLSLTANPNTLGFNVTTVDGFGSPSPAMNFNPASGYSWMFATSVNVISGFSAGQFDINTTGFSNPTGGGFFSISETGNNLFLNFTPVPEPSTWALIGLGVLTVVPFAIRRRRRALRAS